MFELVKWFYYTGIEAVRNMTITLDGPFILSGLCDDSKLWVIKYTENTLDTNIPIKNTEQDG